ncbi:MAG: hypothetical protein NWE91_06885 [Candidatus Bathyarchaeota archaeon]|nr:hypothetical protein [Candidatus Bathyarchaeota archaeon]
MLPYDAAFYVPFAVITLTLTLYFTLLMKLKPSTEIKLSKYMRKITPKEAPKKAQKALKPQKPATPTKLPTENKVEEKECPHYVGYLTTLLKGSPFPDECFGCRKVIQCLRIEPTKVIESFYLQATEAE